MRVKGHSIAVRFFCQGCFVLFMSAHSASRAIERKQTNAEVIKEHICTDIHVNTGGDWFV